MSVRLLLAAAVSVAAPAVPLWAQELRAYSCSDPTGKSYYFAEGLPHDPELGWKEDGIKNGLILVFVGDSVGEGGADVKVRDATGVLVSLETEAKVIFMGENKTLDTIRVDAVYAGPPGQVLLTESYLISRQSSSSPVLTMSTIRAGGTLGKVSVFSASCKKL